MAVGLGHSVGTSGGFGLVGSGGLGGGEGGWFGVSDIEGLPELR